CVTSPEVIVAEYKGVATGSFATVLDTSTSKNSTASATCDSGFKTTTNANDILLGANLAGTITSAPGSNYSNRAITRPLGDLLEDRIVTSTGSYDSVATMSASANCIMSFLAIKEAPNQAPVVSAGPNQSITLPNNSVTLEGVVTDDGLPNNTLTV